MNTGTFLGTVRDPSGAAVAEATIRIERVDTSFRRNITTNTNGEYLAQQIPPGEYRLTFSHPGFQTSVRTGIAISAAQSLRVDEGLKVGSVSETVEVDEKVAQVDTATANVGTTVFGDQVQQLALNTRSFTQLMTLQPGVNSNQNQQPGFGSNTSVPFSFNGSQTSSNNFTLDGSRNLDPYNGNNMTLVNLDAIAEVRIERNAYAAEYGRNSGGQVNVITKSGTNGFHGTAFEFFRNDKLDARNFFAKERPKNRYNNFGWTLGGPIVRDKLFFFLSNEYRRIWQNTEVRTGQVPTDAQLNGDFSASSRPLRGFPDNIIPQEQLDPQAQLLIRNYYARPTPGYQVGALNYTSSEPDGTKYRSGLARLDYIVSPKLTMFGRANLDSTRLISPYGLFATSNIMPYVASSNQSHIPKSGNFTMNWIPSSTVVNTFTVAQYHLTMAISTDPSASRARVPELNIPKIFDNPTTSSILIPSISLSQGYAGIDVRWPQNLSGYTFEIIDNLSIVRGRHNFKFGGQIMKENKSQDNANANNNGTFTFNGTATGDSLADFLTGRAFSYTENASHLWGAAVYTNYSLYAQDQFRVNPRLSLTYGVRWEFYQPEREQNDQLSYFLPSAFNFNQAAVIDNQGKIVPGTENFNNGIIVAGTPQNPFGRAAFNTSWNTFAPRGGFSYALNDKGTTVLRGGFGMFHDRWSQYVNATRTNWPLNQSATINDTRLSDPQQGSRALLPISMTSFNSPWNVPYMMKWSFGVQHQLPAEVLLDVSYVGSRGINLIRTRDINQPRANTSPSSMINALRPYPGLSSITTYETTGQSTYHSLQASATRRFSNGLSLQGSYTWSRTIDNAVTPMNIYADSRMDRAISSFDRSHVFVLSYVYEIPFGQQLKGFSRALLQGWQISGITSIQTGNPLTISVPGDTAGVGGGTQRANVSGPVDMPKTLAEWFDTSAFSSPARGTFGNSSRSIVRGPGFHNWDVSISKWFTLHENIRAQFRGEFFNIWNHTQWAGVNSSFGSAAFGQVTSARDPRITQLGLRLVF